VARLRIRTITIVSVADVLTYCTVTMATAA